MNHKLCWLGVLMAGTLVPAVGISAEVDPQFETLGHPGIARYALGEIKEGSGCGGAMFLASILGYTPEEIRACILEHLSRYAQ